MTRSSRTNHAPQSARSPQPARTVADAAIFARCTAAQRRQLEALSTVVEVPAGRALTHEGRTGMEFGVLIDGQATVSVAGRALATLGPGDHYGEVALLERVDHPDRAVRTATVTAATDLRVAVMTVREFAAVLVELPEAADAVRRSARDRVAASA